MTRDRSLWAESVSRLLDHSAAVASLAILSAMVVAAVIGPWLSPHQAEVLDWSMMGAPPDLLSGHWMGTDRLGRDLLVRTLEGMRISLLIAVAAAIVSLVLGTLWGAIAGYSGGRIDSVMMRGVDVLFAMPTLFFVILLTTLFSRSPLLLIACIGLTGWLTVARVVRSETMALASREFIEASVACGARPAGVVFRHLVPNLAGTVVTYATLLIPQMILVESFLSFLGIGVQEPASSLGNLIAEGAAELDAAPWMLVGPAACLVLLVFCFNYLGDGLRDALDPRRRR
ncbi:MAG: ABC transporter permease [Steroidobacteraceae bacterium]|jgi:oligopeptide transport system permease protein